MTLIQEINRRIAKIAKIRTALDSEQKFNNYGEGCSHLEIKLEKKLQRNINKLELALTNFYCEYDTNNIFFS